MKAFFQTYAKNKHVQYTALQTLLNLENKSENSRRDHFPLYFIIPELPTPTFGPSFDTQIGGIIRYRRDMRALLSATVILQAMISSEVYALHSIRLPWSIAGNGAHISFVVVGAPVNFSNRTGDRRARRSCAPRRGKLLQLDASLAKIPR